MDNNPLLYKNTGSLKIGDVHRFVITYTPDDITQELGSHLYIKVKNIENVLLNSILLTAPYLLYCDVRSAEYNHHNECFITDDQPAYDPNLVPGQSLVHKLTLNKLKDKYVWIVDIVSQIIFSTTAEINFELLISNDDSHLHRNYSHVKNDNYDPKKLTIQHLTTLDIWNAPPPSLSDPIHLVILTHGLHSNSSADMFYMKEQIELMASKTGENIVVRAYFGNVCKTERGVKYLGRRLAEYVYNDSMDGLKRDMVKKISFISHSLGGPVQTFAVSYLNFNYPEFFQNIQPENFITLASPLLGISNENPAYVKVFLKFGIVGKTGQDLNLDGSQPLLLLLPSEITRKILKRFNRRTVYANVLNDGIVPLRTSALLYLDWKGLTKVYDTLKHGNLNLPRIDSSSSYQKSADENGSGNSQADGDEASEIPVSISAEANDPNVTEHNVMSSIKSRIQETLGVCLPGIQAPKTTQKYNFFQTNNMEEPNGNDASAVKEPMTSIPKSSVITSIKKVLLPPSPSAKYINDPKSRYDVILHDKIYTPDMIPKRHTKLSKNVVVSQLEQNKRHRFFEEKIARRWHQGMSWRKVLVYLQPDAHNNMVVRRRFANAYGWQVIDHMVEHHFGEGCLHGDDLPLWALKKSEQEFPDLDESEIAELNRKFSEVMNKEFSKEAGEHAKHQHPLHPDGDGSSPTDAHDGASLDSAGSSDIHGDADVSWLNEASSGHYDGPTNLLNSVNEEMVAWKDSMLNPPTAKDEAGSGSELLELNDVQEMNAYI